MSATDSPHVMQQQQTAPPLAADHAPITLQVGERRFITTKDALRNESAFFAALFSGRWDNAQADGSYFIDANPTLFEHILDYLRRGAPPLFYDNARGHDWKSGLRRRNT